MYKVLIFWRVLMILTTTFILHQPASHAQQGPAPEISLTKKSEPGKPFTLYLTIVDIDSRLPAGACSIFMYHTNSVGDYESGSDGVARIHGTAKSDQYGKIIIHTIYPRGYNNSPTGEHIHFRVDDRKYRGESPELLFSDYYQKRYDFEHPVTKKVYLQKLAEKDGRMEGEAILFVKKISS